MADEDYSVATIDNMSFIFYGQPTITSLINGSLSLEQMLHLHENVFNYSQ